MTDTTRTSIAEKNQRYKMERKLREGYSGGEELRRAMAALAGPRTMRQNQHVRYHIIMEINSFWLLPACTLKLQTATLGYNESRHTVDLTCDDLRIARHCHTHPSRKVIPLLPLIQQTSLYECRVNRRRALG